MPIDKDHKDEIVLGRDLKSGDCIRSKIGETGMGIIVTTTLIDGTLKKYYGDEPAFMLYDINCPCDGPYSSHLKLDDKFEVVKSRDDILYIYRTIEHQLLSRSADLIKQRNELMDIKDKAVDRMNDRCDRIKKEE